MNSINQKQSSLSIQVGPAGRAMAHPMEAELVEFFNQHLSLERIASAQYFAFSLWFEEREFKGFADYFNSESLDEQKHARSFAKYLIARGQSPVLGELPSPSLEWNSIEELISYSFQMEADITSSLHQLYSMSERTSDTRSNVFLDSVIENQTKSEDQFAYLLGKVKFSGDNKSALLLIDSELRD